MTINKLIKGLDFQVVGEEIYALIEDLFPICRSITGNGVRKTLNILCDHIPLEKHEVPSGTKVFDWTVPKEWNINDAYVKNSKGERVIDIKNSNLHVLNYSVPIHKTLSLEELKPHLFTLPDHPELIPYKTSYYIKNWGFCMKHNRFLALADEDYEVFIDSTLADGYLTYAECLIPGKSKDEILISTHVCHPSLANDNLSGVCTSAFLAKFMGDLRPRYSYRFLFIPGTIGAITWLFLNQNSIHNIKHGFVLTGIGDPGKFTYKKSRRGNATIDQVVAYVLKHRRDEHQIVDFSPYGYDERQYCSAGFNLPVGRLSRTLYGRYPQYHTSADNLDFVSSEALSDSFSLIVDIIRILENNDSYTNLSPMCEPQLGKRGLYDKIGPHQLAMLWVLNLSVGSHSLLDIAERSKLDFESIRKAADVLHQFGLLK